MLLSERLKQVIDFILNKEEKTDYYMLTEDEGFQSECDDCGEVYNYDDGEIVNECEVCGCENMIHSTILEGTQCDCCGEVFEPWAESMQSPDYTICTDCYDTMKYLEELSTDTDDLTILQAKLCDLSDIDVLADD